MKNVINILLMGACFLGSTLFAAIDPDSFCLRLNAKVLNAGIRGPGGCTVVLTSENNTVKKRVLSQPWQKFRCHLLRNKQYILTLSQDGFIDKVITINTNIAGSNLEEYDFSFETSLLEAKDLCRFNQQVLEMPVARISYDSRRSCFYYDKDYSEQIKKEMFISYQADDPCGRSGQTLK